MSSYYVQEEDGTSKITLEEGGGSLLLEDGILNGTAASTWTFSATAAGSSSGAEVPGQVSMYQLFHE
jgi:hypothetical protein